MKNTFKSLSVAVAVAPALAVAYLPAVLISGCSKVEYSTMKPGGQATQKTVAGVPVPLGAKQAWQVTVRYEIDAAKAARENGGKALLVQPVPPTMSKGTSSNQEIKATLTCDGKSAQFGKDSFGDSTLMLEVNSQSGKAILEYTGVVFNRDMRGITNGGEEITAAQRKHFTAPYFVNHEAPEVRAFLKGSGLVKGKTESVESFVDRVLVWLARKATGINDTDFSHRENNIGRFFEKNTFNCNTSSAWVAGVLRASGIPVRIMTRVLAKFNGKWDFHADIAYYDTEQKKWQGVTPAGIVSGFRDGIVSTGTAKSSDGFGLDFAPAFESVMIDTASNVGRDYLFNGWSPAGLDYNTHRPIAVSRNSMGKTDVTITHTLVPLKLD